MKPLDEIIDESFEYNDELLKLLSNFQGDNMKFEDIPKEIAESNLVGEMIAWNLLDILIKEIPESTIKDQIQNLIEDRQKQIMKSEL